MAKKRTETAAGAPPAEALQKRCNAFDTGSSPMQQCELQEGHAGEHQWTLPDAWPANMQKPDKKKFTS